TVSAEPQPWFAPAARPFLRQKQAATPPVIPCPSCFLLCARCVSVVKILFIQAASETPARPASACADEKPSAPRPAPRSSPCGSPTAVSSPAPVARRPSLLFRSPPGLPASRDPATRNASWDKSTGAWAPAG